KDRREAVFSIERVASDQARFRIAEIDDVMNDVRQGRRRRQRQRFFFDQTELERAHAVLLDELFEIRLALLEQIVGTAADVVEDMRRRISGVLVCQRDEGAVAPLQAVAAQLQAMAELEI